MILHLRDLRNELAGLKVSVGQRRLLLEEAEQHKATIQAAVDGDLKNELAELKVSIARYSLLLKEAEQREAAVQAALDAYIFPVLTLPLEITTEIFLHYAFAVHEEDDRHGPRLSCRDILLLTTICRAWRRLALSVPGLWSTFDVWTVPRLWSIIDVGDFLVWGIQEKMEEIVHAWFSRAGAMPLSLIGWMGPIESKGSGAINAILRRYAPRFSDLHICVTEPGLVSNLLDNMSFPWLQSLNLCNLADGGPGTPSPPPLPISTFRESPRLRHLNLERIPLVSLEGIRWELLESFATHEISPQECLDVLCKSPSLLKFEFYGSKENSYAVDQRVISHSTLATFHLLNNNCEIMRHLTLPALRVLSFHLQELDDDDFLPFLSRSRGELTSFAFYSLRLGPLVLSMLWFQHMTHLTSLSLSELEAQSGTNVLRALNRHHDPGFLPALADLTLVDWKSDQVDAQLVDALDSRCTATEVEDGRMQLKAFDFIWMDAGPYTADLAFLTSLIDDYRVVLEDWKMRGLEVYIGTEEKNYFG